MVHSDLTAIIIGAKSLVLIDSSFRSISKSGHHLTETEISKEITTFFRRLTSEGKMFSNFKLFSSKKYFLVGNLDFPKFNF